MMTDLLQRPTNYERVWILHRSFHTLTLSGPAFIADDRWWQNDINCSHSFKPLSTSKPCGFGRRHGVMWMVHSQWPYSNCDRGFVPIIKDRVTWEYTYRDTFNFFHIVLPYGINFTIPTAVQLCLFRGILTIHALGRVMNFPNAILKWI